MKGGEEDSSYQSTNCWMSPIEKARTQKIGGSATIPGPMATTSARTITRVKARMCFEGLGMPDDSDSNGCVFLFYFISLHLFEWTVHVLMW